MTAVHVANVQLYLYDDKSEYSDMGAVGCAIVATAGTPPVFRLGCYRGAEYLCTAEITPNNDTGLCLALQGQGYVSFRDDQGRLWSMHFEHDADALSFGAHVSVAMYGAANMPDNRIICCDVAQGKREKPIYNQDRVKARFQTWVVSREDGLPKLGSRLEGNEHDEKPYVYTVPPNHNSVTADMMGFEGMTVGMSEEGRRFVVIPQAAKRGRGPAVHTVHMIYVIKKKDAFEHNDAPQPSAQTAPTSAATNSAPTAVVVTQPGGLYPSQPYQAGVLQYAAQQQLQERPTVVAAPLLQPAPRPLQIEQPPQAIPAPPPAGFNIAQMEALQRMRDQVGNLFVAVRDVTGALDMFAHDFKQHDARSRPSSLLAAQMDHSLRTLLQETDEMRAELTKRDETLNALEERNKQLQAKADKFAKTTQILTDDVKGTQAGMGEVKVDLDQNLLSLQARLSTVLADREDVSRHLATVKRLLEISDKDTRDAKSQLQVAEVTLQTNEAKLAGAEESFQEERARRKLLEAKIATLGDELRSIVDDFRLKDAQVDDRRRQMQADKLHYTQLMDDERAQAATELRELRQELIDELAVRDRRYQEDRTRVAKDSFERGRFQGIEDGEKEALLEGDMQMQSLAFEAQRHRSELETIKVRLRQVHEQAAADRRRLEAQISALTRVIDELAAQNQTMETERHALEAAKETVASAAFEEVRAAVLRLSQPIGKNDMRMLIHSLRAKQNIDFNFEFTRAEERRARADSDVHECRQWVRRCLTAAAAGHNPYEAPPPLQYLAPQDPPVTEPVAVPSATDGTAPPPLFADVTSIRAVLAATDPSFDMGEVDRRHKELLMALHANNPALELAPPPPPPPPTPPHTELTPLQRPATPPLAEEPQRADDAATTQATDHNHTSARSEEPQTQQLHPDEPEPATEHATQQQPDEPEPATAHANHAQQQPDEPEPATGPLPSARNATAAETTDAEPAAGTTDVREETVVSSTRAALFDAEGDEDDDALPSSAPANPLRIAPVVGAAAKRAPPTSSLFGGTDSEDDEDDEKNAPRAPKVVPRPAAAPLGAQQRPAAASRSMFADSDSEEEDAPIKPPPPAPKQAGSQRPTGAPPAAKPGPKRPARGMFADTDESDA